MHGILLIKSVGQLHALPRVDCHWLLHHLFSLSGRQFHLG